MYYLCWRGYGPSISMTTIGITSCELNIITKAKSVLARVCEREFTCETYFYRCLGIRESSHHGNQTSVTASSKSGRSQHRRKNKKKTMLLVDLNDGPLELLGNMEWVTTSLECIIIMFIILINIRTLLSFEQYLYTECGPLSMENISYQLWKSVLKYSKTTQLKRKDALAVQIHRTFVYEHSSRCIALPEGLKEQLKPREEIQRPATPTLLALKELAGEILDIAVKKFMYSEEDNLGSLPSLGKSKLSRTVSRSSKVRCSMMWGVSMGGVIVVKLW